MATLRVVDGANQSPPTISTRQADLLYIPSKEDRQGSDGLNATSMDCLPDEMVLQIFSYLSPQELFYSTSFVCQRWERLAVNISIWTQTSGFCYHTPFSQALSMASPPAPPLKTLVLHSRDDAAVLLRDWFGRCDVLQRVDLISCRFNSMGSLLLAQMVEFFPHLRMLSLESSGQPQEELDYSLITGFRKLTALNLSQCKKLPSNTITKIANNCSHLQELRLDWVMEIFDEDVIHAITQLKDLLKVLTLGGEHLTDVTYIHLAICTKLTELGLAPCGMLTDQGLIEGLGPLKHISALQLTDAGALSTPGLISFFSCPSMSLLTSLVLAWCTALDDNILKLIAHRCLKLKYLSIKHCQKVSDGGIANIVLGCRNLESLSLVWNDRLRGRGFLPLLATELPLLHHLDLGYCDNIVKEAVDQLMLERRDIKVVIPEVWCRPRKIGHKCCGHWDSTKS